MKKLIFEKTGETVKLNQVYPDFRGERWVITSWSIGNHPGSTGRVYCYPEGKTPDGYTEREFFPGVFGMKIVEEEK